MSAPPPTGAGAAAPAPAEQPRKSNAPVVIAIVAAAVLGGCLILGVLAAIALPAFMRVRDRAKSATVRNDLRAIAMAEERFRLDDPDRNGVNDYAPSIEALMDADLLDEGLLRESELRSGWKCRVASAGRDHFVLEATPPPGSREAPIRLDETGAFAPAR